MAQEVEGLLFNARLRPKVVQQRCRELFDSGEADARVAEARAWAEFELGDLVAAQATIAAAMSSDEFSVEDRIRLAQVDVAVHTALGVAGIAAARLQHAISSLESVDADTALALATALAEAGERDAARQQFDALLRRPGLPRLFRARALNNRAVSATYEGRIDEAFADLSEATELIEATDGPAGRLGLAITEHNTANLFAQRGELAEALRRFDSAQELMGSGPIWLLGPALLDWTQVLLDAGLTHNAESIARSAAQAFAQVGAPAQCAEAHALATRASSAAGDWARAQSSAASAVAAADAAGLAAFRRRGLKDQLRLARAMHALEQGVDTRVLDLDVQSDESQGLSAELALPVGERLELAGDAEQAFVVYSAARSTVGKSAVDRLSQAVLDCRCARLQGQAHRVLEIGHLAVEDAGRCAAILGVTELRSTARRRLLEIASEVSEAALCLGNPDQAVAVFEGERSTALMPEPAATEHEAELIAKMRGLVARLRSDRTDDFRRVAINDELHEIEQRITEIRRRSQTGLSTRPSNDPSAGSSHPPTVHLLLALDRVIAVVATGGRSTLIEVCERAVLARSLRRWNLSVDTSADGTFRLDDTGARGELVSVLRPLLDGMEALQSDVALMVADPRIGSIPWPLLTKLALHHADSSIAWHELTARSADDPLDVVAVAGPELAHANTEVRSIGAHADRMRVLAGAEATASRLIDHLGDCAVLHVAAHGAYRSDRPLMTNLGLADGPLTLLELSARRRMPPTVILSACDVGRRGAHAATSLPAMLFGRGTSTVIAATGPTSDAGMAELMHHVYRWKTSGQSWVHALALAQAETTERWPSLARVELYGK